MTTKVLCPRCQKSSSLAVSNPYRPFCSERCKLIDLGSWASEEYKIPAEDSPSLDQDESSANNDNEH
ncbi:DNA gyrase inhibitor YacG [Candidatus Berkiella aquae]|nr:DNA gyrase inhibitor YacG [Candidatus Berkiella aquae]MCS5710824.1 DNA gyrase inhibitor YacG [Candidatus Berkiella aquae]